ncbi:MAG: DUF4388 domain-containing protein [Deltaproteobacteria bacterium]|nr:DUF4388 domain-containing protein [Deltaproteobacteria bacterium]
MATEGDLKEIGMSSLVQMICLENAQATLLVKRDREEGIICINEGDVIHAQTGSFIGELAFYRLLSWHKGTFRIYDHVKTLKRTVKTPWRQLLMEGLRMIDEWNAIEGHAERRREELTPEQVQQDQNLEKDLVLLLSQFEQIKMQMCRVSRFEKIMAGLGRRAKKRRALLALELLPKMINDVVFFSEEHLAAGVNTDKLARALVRAGDMFPRARLLQAENNRLSAATIITLYDNWTADAAGRQHTFHDVSRGMVDVLETYFSMFIACFHAQHTAEQCREACNVFITDLSATVDEIIF